MGGLGSSRWGGYQRKTQVEECQILSISSFRRLLRLVHQTGGDIRGRLVLKDERGMALEIDYFVFNGDAGPAIEIIYDHWLFFASISNWNRLQVSAVDHGWAGLKWGFHCPVVNGGVICLSRGYKLYLPPGVNIFGCRRCHDLTYRKCQAGTL